MTQSFLNIDIDSIDRYSGALFTGKVYFSVGDSFFPEEKWDDFLNVILNWWLIELSDLMEQKITVAKLRFMDGPYFVTINSNRQYSICEFSMVEDRKNLEINSVEISIDQLLKSIKSEVNKLLRFYNSQSIFDDEINQMEKNFDRFQKNMIMFR